MKILRSIILTCSTCCFFAYSWFSRYQPVSLDLAAPTTITCEIKGEIAWPGVYTLANGSTLQMLIEEAGGLLEKGDTSALSLLDPLCANEVVVIPEKKEQPKISISTASQDELCTLPGIGPALASRIIEYRQEHAFCVLEDIKQVKGIGDKLFDKIKEEICL